MKTELKLSLDEDLVRAAKAVAVRQGTSIEAILTEELRKLVGSSDAYEMAQRRALARLEAGWNLEWHPFDDRNQLYE
jgi:hypothetical protein